MTPIPNYIRWLLVVLIFLGGFVVGYRHGQDKGIVTGRELGIAEGQADGLKQGLVQVKAVEDKKEEAAKSAVIKDINPFKESATNPFDKPVINPFETVNTNPFK